MSIISYAQNFEDVMLWRALGHVEDGFYIDIGAQDPIVDSVSLAFSENGWKGVSVEPTQQYADRIRKARPGEFLEQVAIGSNIGTATIYAFPDTGLTTADAEIAARHTAAGFNVVELEIDFMSMDELLSKYGDRDIHWLKIDVEGFERSVIESWQQSSVRPWVLVVESTEPLTQNMVHENWEHLVLAKNYELAYFDGLNRFYVHDAHRELLGKFNAPPNVFDGFSLSGEATHSFCDLIKGKVRQAEEEEGRNIETLLHRVTHVEGVPADIVKALGQMASLNERLLDISTQLARYQAETVHLQREVEGKQEALERVQILQRQLAEAEAYGAQHEQRAHRAHALEAECNALRQSWSWRISAPLRWSLDLLAHPGQSLRHAANHAIHKAIHISRRPLSRVIAMVLRNPKQSERINLWLIQRFPALHGQLRAVAQGIHSPAPAMPERPGTADATLHSLSPRARQIYADLNAAIKKQQEG